MQQSLNFSTTYLEVANKIFYQIIPIKIYVSEWSTLIDMHVETDRYKFQKELAYHKK